TQDIDEMAQKQGGGAGDEGLAPSSTDEGLAPGGTDEGLAPSSSDEGLAPSSSGTGTTGIGDSGGMDDISFEDVSLDELPMDEAPKTQLSPRKAETAMAGAGLDDDLIPLDQEPQLEGASESTVALGDIPSMDMPDTNPAPASSGRLAMEQASF